MSLSPRASSISLLRYVDSGVPASSGTLTCWLGASMGGWVLRAIDTCAKTPYHHSLAPPCHSLSFPLNLFFTHHFFSNLSSPLSSCSYLNPIMPSGLRMFATYIFPREEGRFIRRTGCGLFLSLRIRNCKEKQERRQEGFHSAMLPHQVLVPCFRRASLSRTASRSFLKLI